MSRFAQDSRVAIGAHAAGVGTLVAIEDRFVILAGGQRQGVAPVAERDEADLFAGQKLLDHQSALQRGEGGFRLRGIVRDHHAFARRQAIGLQHHGKAEASQRHARLRGVVDRGVGGGRDSSLLEKVLCENLTAFQSRRFGVRSDDAQAARAEGIHDARHQRHFRSDHRQVRARSAAAASSGSPGTQVATRAIPGLPGQANTSTPSDCASFQHRACSLPPLPITSIFIHRTMVAMPDRYDVVVIGAGHAGCEAARACARIGLRTAMVTMNLDLIAQMSCNPAIGGIAKGHLVREIDALGGVMGEVADSVGIQFRLLNTSRGPAVWSPRAQMDKKLYRHRMREVLENEPNLRIKQAEVAALTIGDDRRVTGVLLRDGRTVEAGAVIVTTGTFLNGLAHVGEMTYSCGRNGEAPSQLLGDQLRTLGLNWTRLKTGTPPRLDGRTIDWSQFEPQPGDAVPDAVLLHDRADRPRRRFSATSGTPPKRRGACCRRRSRALLYIAGRSRAWARGIARRSKTRSSSSRTSPVTRFFSNRKAWIPTRCT